MNGQKLALFFFFSFYVYAINAQEICTNSIDDDADGLIDLNDPDCKCNGITDQIFVPSSLIPNPSFEDYNCCPTGIGQLSCAKNWIQASIATSDYYHTCGNFTRDPRRGAPPLPLPAGNGYIGILDLQQSTVSNTTYKEYVGACLNKPMQSGKDYTLSFWVGFGTAGDTWGPRISTTLAIFGTLNCSNLPFGLPNGQLCPTAYPNWFEIKRVNATGVNKWTKVTTSFRPIGNFSAIVIGPQCARADGNYYFFIDELILEESTKFDSIQLSLSGKPCDDDIELFAQTIAFPHITYQWFLNGIAIPGATTPNFKIPNRQEGNYVLRAFDGNNCELSNVYKYTRDTFTTSVVKEICEGDFVRIGGNSITQSGKYNFQLKSILGCDSIVDLDLTVRNKYATTIDTTVCEGTLFSINGKNYNQSGTYFIPLKSIHNCDSNIFLTLNVVNILYSTFDTFLCKGNSILINNVKYDTSGQYTWQGISIGNCDSIVNINIKEYPIKNDSFKLNFCTGDTVQLGNKKFHTQGDFSFLEKSIYSCDSFVFVKVDLLNKSFLQIDTTICEGEFVTFNNQQFTTSGKYKLNLKNQAQCDSIVDIQLQVNQNTEFIIDTSICKGNKLTINGTDYRTQGRHIQKYSNALQCDSNLIINITEHNIYNLNIDTSICDRIPISINNQTYNKAGLYNINLVTQFGCDSLIELNIHEGFSSFRNIDTLICEGDFIPFGNDRLSATGRYTKQFQNISKCDSTISYNLTVLSPKRTTIDTTICFKDTISIGNQNYFTKGNYLSQFKSYQQCDSIVSINVNVRPEITANAQIQQIRCYGDNNGIIQISSNQSNQKFLWSNGDQSTKLSNLKAGDYKVTITDEASCQNIFTYTIIEPKALQLDYFTEDANCRRNGTGILTIESISGGTEPLSLKLNNRQLEVDTQTLIITPATYELLLEDTFGCTLIKTIEIKEPVRGTIDIREDSLFLIVGDSFEIKIELADIEKIDTLIWTGNGIFSCQNCLRTSFIPLQDNTRVEVTLIDENGCLYKDFVIFRIKQNVHVPNVFSPNGDRINDYFNLISDSSVEIIDELRIYDRWGEEIYRANNILPNTEIGAWDGTFRNELVMPGVYVYMINYHNKIGNHFSLVGDITVLR